MGIHENIGYDTFPKQSTRLGKRVKVCFNFDTSRIVHGVVVRDDEEEPGEMLIKLDDGRYVRAVECMYSTNWRGRNVTR